jgi:hypothetical protein
MSILAQSRTYSTGDRVVAAYRQAWLATLGAAAVTRDWMQHGAAPLIRSLVKEGALVEGQAMRVVESRVGSSYRLANTALHRARRQIGQAIGRARTTLPVTLATLPVIARRMTLAVAAPRAKSAPAAAHAKSGGRRAQSAAQRAKPVAKRANATHSAKRAGAANSAKRANAAHAAKPAKTTARATPRHQVRKTTRTRSGA